MTDWKELFVPYWIFLIFPLIVEMIPSLSKMHMSAEAATIERFIVDSAAEAEMFDFFHLMPEGNVEVMTEWDLLLTMDQYQALHEKPDKSGGVKRKNEIGKLWPNCRVFYEIHDKLQTKRDIAVINEAIKEWEKYTCLNFIEDHSKPRRIQFKDGGGCYSKLGMQDKPQPLVLARGCRTKVLIVHEIGHAIGLIHEHMRPDRDDYIKVDFSLIETADHKDYIKYDSNSIIDYGVHYDYTSLMHYGNGVYPDSLLTGDPKYQDKIGQIEGLSFKDIKLVNVMYKCDTGMCFPHLDCGQGFQFYKEYKGQARCQCWCDSGDLSDPLILCSEKRPTTRPPQPSPQPSYKPTEIPKKQCMDVRKDCEARKRRNHCMTNMELMVKRCSKTCNFCEMAKKVCMDHDKGCTIMAIAGACTKPGFRKVMEDLCKASCGLCPKSPNPCDIQKNMLGDEP